MAKTLRNLRRWGKHLTIRSRKLRYATAEETVTPEPGLNVPETKIARALRELKITFQVQQAFLGGSILGGLKVDFVLPDYHLALDFKGPWHFTAYGAARDVLKDVVYRDVGLRRITLNDQDLKRLKPRLLEIVGQPTGV